jgi:hypothetical protein
MADPEVVRGSFNAGACLGVLAGRRVSPPRGLQASTRIGMRLFAPGQQLPALPGSYLSQGWIRLLQQARQATMTASSGC